MITPCRTFASDARPYPRRRNDWERLADFAAELHASQAEQLPRLIADGQFTEQAAADRLRRLAAIAELWRRVGAAEPLPPSEDCTAELGASSEAMLAEADKFARFARDRAKAKPDARLNERAELTEALAWHLRPIAAGAMPHIFIAADHERWLIGRAQPARAA